MQPSLMGQCPRKRIELKSHEAIVLILLIVAIVIFIVICHKMIKILPVFRLPVGNYILYRYLRAYASYFHVISAGYSRCHFWTGASQANTSNRVADDEFYRLWCFGMSYLISALGVTRAGVMTFEEDEFRSMVC